MPPPKSSLTSSFSVSDASNEVVCPLRNQDGSNCRKRCFGEKRYRSMQEHIRRAHPEHYIPKLPATEESFNAMINTPPSERPPPPPPKPTASTIHSSPGGHPQSYDSSNFYSSHQSHAMSSPIQSRHSHEARRGSLLPAASAAAALAQLHNSRPENEWDHDQVLHHLDDFDPFPGLAADEAFTASKTPFGPAGGGGAAAGDHLLHPHHQQQLHHHHHQDDLYMTNFFANDGTQDLFPDNHHNMSPPVSRDYLTPGLQRTPSASARASSLQPFPRGKPNRPRKSSVTKNARKPKHERDRSKDYKRLSHERKAFSAEPQAAAVALGTKRWEDLLDAAASATEEDSRDLTPIPQSPRSSMPPFAGSSQQQPPSYTASPLQNSVLPRTPDPEPAAPPPPQQQQHHHQHQQQPPQPPQPPSSSFSPNMQPFPSVEAPPPFEPQPTPHQQPYHQHHHQHSNDSVTSNPYATPYQRHHHPPHPHHQHHSSGSNFHMQAQGLSSSPDDHHHHQHHAHQHHQHNNSSSSSTGHVGEGNSLSALARAGGVGAGSHGLHASSLYGSSHPASSHQDGGQRPPSHHSGVSAVSAAMPGPTTAAAATTAGTATTASAAGNYSLAPSASPPAVQHYCAACRRLAPLTSSYACTECICGICRECVDALISMGPNREAPCPRCQTVGGRFKPFMIDLR